MERTQTAARTDVTGGASESTFVEEIDGLQLWYLGTDRFDDFNRFIYRVYSEAFVENGSIPFSLAEIEASSEAYYRRTKLCGITDGEGNLVGTWGLVLKNIESDAFQLPIEARFGLTDAKIIEAMSAQGIRFLFNGWRTAVDKHALERLGFAKTKSIFVFDYLLRGLTADFDQEANAYIGVSEMELLVLKYHRRVGIPWVVLGEPLHFWGRDRYPCGFKLGEFEDYLRIHHPDRHRFIYRKPADPYQL